MTPDVITPVPAPWSLTGNGLILIYRFPESFVIESGFLPPEMRSSFAGGFGTVMIVDYASSDVGGYGELLFIPGMFRQTVAKRFSITKIYVSTQTSVENGWRNWAIPKERADFTFDRRADHMEQVRVSKDGEPVFEMSYQPRGIRLPVNTRWFPLTLSLGQPQNDELLITAPFGSGRAQFIRIHEVKVNASLFPDIAQLKPFLALKMSSFKMTFPVADRVSLNGKG